MKSTRIFRCRIVPISAIVALACMVGAAHADAPKVRVDWTDPAQLADVRESMCTTRTKPEEWLGELAGYVQRRADKVIAPGQRLDVTIADIRRAGICEMWRGPRWDDVRIVKDIYPPRIDLRYTLMNDDGALVRKGEAKLRDPGFLSHGTPNSNDPLRYEKRMLDDWLRREFAP